MQSPNTQKQHRQHRGFRARWRDMVKRHSSSYTPLCYPASMGNPQYPSQYNPQHNNIYQTGPSHYGAELNSLQSHNSPYRSNTHKSPRPDHDSTNYHYVPGFGHDDTASHSHFKPKLDESFYESVPNRTEAGHRHDDGLKGVKILDSVQTESASTTEFSPDFKSPRQASSHPLANLASQTVSCGLQNLGNTCYMNSVLQCLFNNEKLRNYFLQGGHLLEKQQIPLTDSFVELMSTAFTKNVPVDKPLAHFKDTIESVAPVFEGFTQNDAHEFFRLLVEKIHDELNNGCEKDSDYTEFTPSAGRMTIYQLAEEWKKYSHDRDNSMITSIFGGILLNEVICNSCKYVSYTFEDALDLSLNLANTKETSSSHSRLATTLYTCLKRFTTPEPVEGYACENCHHKNTSVKRTTVWKQPETLVVQFKRFVYDNYGNRSALKERVSFPIGTMTLDYFTHEKSNESRGRYKLQGIVNHYGDLNGGHYIAYIYNDQLNTWLKYNDHQVRKIDEREIEQFGQASVEPYILFYKRV